MLTFRRALQDYEAILNNPAGMSRCGKIEWKRYGNGETRLKARIHDLGPVDRGTVRMVLNGVEICEIGVERGRCKLDLRSSDGDPVPAVHTGKLVDILYGDQVVLTGIFRFD